VIILTGTMPERRTVECVEAGVEGLVLKQTEAALLLTCLNEVKQGRRWIDQTVLQKALGRATGNRGDNGPLAKLSAREREIVQLVGDNLRTRAIADKLGISEGTVKVHLHNAYQKLGVRSRIEIVLMMRGLD
jgi:two-component system nitrate/nitrite response regulator NarP